MTLAAEYLFVSHMEITGKTSTCPIGKRFGEVFLQFHFVKVPKTDMMIFSQIEFPNLPMTTKVLTLGLSSQARVR